MSLRRIDEQVSEKQRSIVLERERRENNRHETKNQLVNRRSRARLSPTLETNLVRTEFSFWACSSMLEGERDDVSVEDQLRNIGAAERILLCAKRRHVALHMSIDKQETTFVEKEIIVVASRRHFSNEEGENNVVSLPVHWISNDSICSEVSIEHTGSIRLGMNSEANVHRMTWSIIVHRK